MSGPQSLGNWNELLGLATMTSAAKCDKGCELQKFVSHHFLERNWHQDDESWYE